MSFGVVFDHSKTGGYQKPKKKKQPEEPRFLKVKRKAPEIYPVKTCEPCSKKTPPQKKPLLSIQILGLVNWESLKKWLFFLVALVFQSYQT